MRATWTQFPASRPISRFVRRFGRTGPGGRRHLGRQGARASHPTARFVAGVLALTVLALVGLWIRAGAGPGLGSSSIVPSTVIAALALAAVASTYRLEHRPRLRPRSCAARDLGTPAARVRALAQANAAHMAGVSHIRILDEDPGVAFRAQLASAPPYDHGLLQSGRATTTCTNLLSSKTIRTPVTLPTDVADAKRSR